MSVVTLPLPVPAAAAPRPMLALRPYQREAVEAIGASALRRQVVALPTGTGKTVIFAHLIAAAACRGERALALVHRDELVGQTLEKLAAVAPGLAVGVVKAERDETGAPVVVASVQTLARARRLERLARNFSLIIVDECFPAGTLVDGRPIEDITVGDTLTAWDERRGIVRSRVSAVMRQPVGDVLVRIHAAGRQVTCTPNHPFLTARGWALATDLREGDNLATAAMHVVWDDDRPAEPKPEERLLPTAEDLLFAGVLSGSDQEEGPGRLSVQRVRGTHCETHAQSAQPLPRNQADVLQHGVLRGGATQTLVSADGADESALCVRSYAGQESHERPTGPHGDGRHPANHGSQAMRARWQRPRPDQTRGPAGGRAGLADECDRADQDGAGVGLSNALQARPCSAGAKNSSGGRRHLARQPGAQGPGQQEARLPGFARVDRVEILEPGRDGTFGGVCPDGYVYNLEVEEQHTYVANGFVVHNCHHAMAPTWRAVLTYLRCFEQQGPLTLGFTATPERADGAPLGDVFEGIVYRQDILGMIRAGYLCDVRGVRITLAANLDGVHSRGGDFVEGELAAEMTRANAPEQIRDGYLEHAAGRKALAFLPSVSLSEQTADLLSAAGVAAEVLSAQTPLAERRALLRDLRAGTVEVVANCGVLTEGFDEPSVDCLLLGRPTHSRPLYVQMVGRVLRTFPGKECALVLDFVGASARHQLLTLASLLPVQGARSVCESAAEQEAAGAAPGTQRHDTEELGGGPLVAQAVDLLGRATLHWARGEGRAAGLHVLPLPNYGGLLLAPQPHLDDAYEVVRLERDHVGECLGEALPLDYAQGVAEDWAREHEQTGLAQRDARWRARPASEKTLRQWDWAGRPRPAGITQGRASDLLALRDALRALRRRRAQAKGGAARHDSVCEPAADVVASFAAVRGPHVSGEAGAP